MNSILRGAILVFGTGLLLPVVLSAQQPAKKAKPAVAVAATAAEPKLKGVWEPVSYPADAHLNDVYFATPDIGWVTAGAHGKPGMIIHTKDGGASWTAQLGDPESSDPSFHDLRFIDAHHGWVLQDAGSSEYKLLNTSDGENWSPIGSIKLEWGMPDYSFISPSEGLYIDGNDNVSRIMRTADGGRTWNEVFACNATLQIEGLTKKVNCALKTLHFPSRRVGYALGGAHGAKRTLFVAKTKDGGATWSLSVVPEVGGDLEVYFRQEVFFTDENTGVASLSDKRIYRTTDGGRSWKGVVGTPGPVIRFADPIVGWSFPSYRTLSYTTDGGTKWSTREFAFPAKVNAFNLPRRDRAFVVGEHGMIYRYRVIGQADAAPPKAIPAPAMPLFDSPLDDQVGELGSVVAALEARVAAAPDAAAGGAGAQAKAAPAGAEGAAENPQAEQAAAAEAPGEGGIEASVFTATCCSKPLAKFDLVRTAVAGLVPQFLGQFKNTNLLVAGLQMLTDLPARLNELNRALQAFRKAPDKASAMSALAQVSTAIAALSQSTAVAFQRQVPPPAPEPGQPATAVEVTGGAADPSQADQQVQADAGAPLAGENAPARDSAGGKPAVVDQAVSETGEVITEAAREAKEESKQNVKQDAKKAVKKKLRF